MRLEEVELVHVRLPYVRPFVTARGTSTHKECVLVRVRTAGGVTGWGECAAEAAPTYAPEFVDGAWLVLRDHLVPRLLSGRSLTEVRGHHMARAALEMALLDTELVTAGIPLACHLGATRDRVPAGVVVELGDEPGATARTARERVAEGYRRIKIKVAPGKDLAHAAAVRAEIGRAVPLWADANGSYTLDDVDTLRALDVDLLEQPLRAGDLLDHARLAHLLDTPVCLDESIDSVDTAALALHVRAADVVCLKPARVGGLRAAIDIHDRCMDANVPVWCGGMLETGIGRAANVALAALPGFVLPGDLSASNRYFAEDLTDPFELDRDGCLVVPTSPGLGVEVDERRIDAATVRRERITGR
jgi:O-succinylbenzoate synthase